MTGRPGILAVVRWTAAALTLTALAHTLWHGVEERATALAFGVLVAVGALARSGACPGRPGPPYPGKGTPERCPAPRRPGHGVPYEGPAVPVMTYPVSRPAPAEEPAPLATAGAIGYALLGDDACRGGHPGVWQVVTVVVGATLAGSVPHLARGGGPHPDALARRVLVLAFAAVCAAPPFPVPDAARAPLVAAVLALTALCEALLAAAQARARTGWPFGPLLRDALRALPGIGSAICATGAVMALAVGVAGLWALPVLCLPLLLTQLALRRHGAVLTVRGETITALARATEIAGHTPHGHARRVAALSRAVGRDLGLNEAQLTVLEHAALMHDIGQLSLLDPLPAGATAALPGPQQLRIARLGGAVVRQAGVDPQVAAIVEQQSGPYREQSLSARIVRVANAYDELARAAGSAGPSPLEQLRRATARDYQPRVVESLARVLERGGPAV